MHGSFILQFKINEAQLFVNLVIVMRNYYDKLVRFHKSKCPTTDKD